MRIGLGAAVVLAACAGSAHAFDMDDVKDAANSVTSHAKRLHDEAEAMSPTFGAKLNSVASASNALTHQATSAMEAAMGTTMSILKRMLGVTEEMLKSMLTALANLGFCAVMLFGFMRLPPDFMLVVGLFTFFVGPTLVLFVFDAIGFIGFLAAWMPMLFVAVLFLVTVFKSKAVQWLTLRLGFDRNRDGKVDLKDAVHAVQHLPAYVSFKAWVQRFQHTSSSLQMHSL